MIVGRLNRLVIAIVVALGLAHVLLAQDDFWGHITSLSRGTNGVQWHYAETRKFAPRTLEAPNEGDLSRLVVEWTGAELDELGHNFTVSGRLLVTGNGGPSKPVHWQQLIAVLLALDPAATPDWTNGANCEIAFSHPAGVQQDGTFSATFDLWKCSSPLTESRELQAGVSLARQESPGPDQLSIRVDSSCPALAQSIRMVKVPPAKELPEIIRLIERASGWPDEDSSAVELIRAANALQKMERDDAIQTLDDYMRMRRGGDWSDSDVIYGLIQCAFDSASKDEKLPSPGYLRFLLDQPDLSPAALWPRDPMEISDDIPWLLGTDVNLSGSPGNPEDDLKWLKRHGLLRDAPLRPADNPVESAERLMSERRFLQLPERSKKESRTELMTQSYAMVADLLPPIPDESWDRPDVEAHWPMLLEASRTTGLFWDEEIDTYAVRPDK